LTPDRPGPEDTRVILRDTRGLGLVEIAIVLVVLAIVGAVLYQYLGSTAKTLETIQQQRPMSQARLTADRATLQSIRAAMQIYYAQNGSWPPSKETIASLMSPPPNFQCEGNDYTYDPQTGQIGLVIDDAARC
jgi:Tfp pilus assembly protein PilE